MLVTVLMKDDTGSIQLDSLCCADTNSDQYSGTVSSHRRDQP